ncbi:MAG: AAA family ATPase, partial [Desulfuromusa sp.]|nr:AAA family ATPase [Desulfuromusa sp.]
LGFEEKQTVSEADGDACLEVDSGIPNGFNYTGMTLRDARQQVERTLLQQALERSQGNILKAAEELDVSRPTLYDLLKRYGLQE